MRSALIASLDFVSSRFASCRAAIASAHRVAADRRRQLGRLAVAAFFDAPPPPRWGRSPSGSCGGRLRDDGVPRGEVLRAVEGDGALHHRQPLVVDLVAVGALLEHHVGLLPPHAAHRVVEAGGRDEALQDAVGALRPAEQELAQPVGVKVLGAHHALARLVRLDARVRRDNLALARRPAVGGVHRVQVRAERLEDVLAREVALRAAARRQHPVLVREPHEGPLVPVAGRSVSGELRAELRAEIAAHLKTTVSGKAAADCGTSRLIGSAWHR